LITEKLNISFRITELVFYKLPAWSKGRWCLYFWLACIVVGLR
jgi:hypothetical protein